MIITLAAPYEPRAIRCLELWKTPGWQVKVYGIAYGKPRPEPDLIRAAKRIGLQLLTTTASKAAHYGLGFMGIHEGRGANFVFVDWWAEENELHHHVFISSSDEPLRLESRDDDGPIACIWDLGVVAFERKAWVETVLDNAEGPDAEAYLARQMNEDL